MKGKVEIKVEKVISSDERHAYCIFRASTKGHPDFVFSASVGRGDGVGPVHKRDCTWFWEKFSDYEGIPPDLRQDVEKEMFIECWSLLVSASPGVLKHEYSSNENYEFIRFRYRLGERSFPDTYLEYIWSHAGIAWDGIDLHRSNMRNSCCSGMSLVGANLSGCDCYGSNFKKANLRAANLQNANFEGANLESADFRGANLKNANFKGANLRFAELEGADTRGLIIGHKSAMYVQERGGDLRFANIGEPEPEPRDPPVHCWIVGIRRA